jgi:hypothetical protein
MTENRLTSLGEYALERMDKGSDYVTGHIDWDRFYTSLDETIKYLTEVKAFASSKGYDVSLDIDCDTVHLSLDKKKVNDIHP